jgi:hypothetical protein
LICDFIFGKIGAKPMATTLSKIDVSNSEEFVVPPLAPRRQREAHIRQFQLEQMTSNEWISFERAVSCLTGQKDLATASDARRNLLDAICAGKIHSGNPRALQCLDASSGDDWHWSVSDFRALVEHREGLVSVLKNTYLERDSLLPWMKGCGFDPTADIQRQISEATRSPTPDKQQAGLENAIVLPRMIPIPAESPPTATEKQRATLRALLEKFPARELEWPRSWEGLAQKLNKHLLDLSKKNAIPLSAAKTSSATIRRVLRLRKN